MLYHNYIFFDIEPSINALTADQVSEAKRRFSEIIAKEPKVKTFSYVTLGLKTAARLMLWFQADRIESIQQLLNQLLHSELGRHLKISQTLFGLVRPSQYTHRSTAQEQAIDQNDRSSYLIVYPFTKTKQWYLLPFEQRKELMVDHIRTGHKFGSIRQLLLYAFGVDDHEFIVSYETESLEDFQSLVIELRSTKARLYTENDLPIFTCIHRPLIEALEVL